MAKKADSVMALLVILTLGPEGAVLLRRGAEPVHAAAAATRPVDTTGAGDTFAGVLAACLDEGRSLRDAMALAAVAGSLACTRLGAQPALGTPLISTRRPPRTDTLTS